MSSQSITAGYIDLATMDVLESEYLYGTDEESVTYFVRKSTKSTWFTQIPVTLHKSSSSSDFGSDWTVTISRAADYLLNVWLRVTVPSVTLDASNQFGTNGRLRWTRNFMHNLIADCYTSFNEISAGSFNHYHLDFWSAFTVPAGKRNAYNNMIGNFDDMTGPHAPGVAIPSFTLNLPLPFWFCTDTGIALPTAALPYNDMKIHFKFREWQKLLVLDNLAAPAGSEFRATVQTSDLTGGAPSVASSCQVWANYALVDKLERDRMGCAPREMIVDRVYQLGAQKFNPSTNPTPTFDLRFSYAVRAVFFGMANVTHVADGSNYTCASPIPGSRVVDFYPANATDPILETTLAYESTHRLSNMGSDYFSLVNPYYHAPVVPTETGYHCYSFALDFTMTNPNGSTNWGKLANVSMSVKASQNAIDAANGAGAASSGTDFAQSYEFVLSVLTHTVILISGGTLGFPVM